jgi:hypothetical protein
MVTAEKPGNRVSYITLDRKRAGKPIAGNRHDGFEVAGAGTQLTVRLMRHSKGNGEHQLGGTYGVWRLPSTQPASAQALQHSLFEGIQDGHVEVRKITFVPSGHGEAMNSRRGGHHGVLT